MHIRRAAFGEAKVHSLGTVDDDYDDALAEITIGLFRTECFRTRTSAP